MQNAHKVQRAGKPVFDVVLEVEGGGDDPRCYVVKRVGAVVDELLAKGGVPKPEVRAPLPRNAVIHNVMEEVCMVLW